MPLRIVVADDHSVVREGIKALLEREGFDVVAEAADGREAVRFAEKLRPDVAVLDVAMPSLNGIDAAREIIRASPRTKTVLLSMHPDDTYVLQALRAGITGYVLKSAASAKLVEAIRVCVGGEVYLSPGVSRTVVDALRYKQDVPDDPLTSREREVLQLVAEGKTTKEIATQLGISVRTAESHRSNISEKLDLHDTASLVRYAIRRGLILS